MLSFQPAGRNYPGVTHPADLDTKRKILFLEQIPINVLRTGNVYEPSAVPVSYALRHAGRES